MDKINYSKYDEEILIEDITISMLHGKSVSDILQELYDSIGAKATIDSDGIRVPPYRNRSLISLYQIVKTYRPSTTVEEVIKAIVTTKFSNGKRLYPGFCSDIGRCNLFFHSPIYYSSLSTENIHPFINYDDLMDFEYEDYGDPDGGFEDDEGEFYEYNIARDNRDAWPYYFHKAGITKEDYISMFEL